MRRRIGTCVWLAAAVAALTIAAPATVRAGEAPHRHDGFFLRLAAGFGFGGNRVVDDDGKENVIRGGANTSSVAIGAFVAENLAVHAELFHGVLVEPQVVVDGVEAGEAAGLYALGGVGVGVTWYFMPLNLYLSGSIGATVLRADIGWLRVESDPGLGVDFLVGKEWWVSDNWGIGVAGQFIYSDVPSQYETSNHSFAGSVLFSASYG